MNEKLFRQKIRNDFMKLEDGYLYYWPKTNRGAISSATLRIIADELDSANLAWNRDIDRYFERTKGSAH